MTFFDHCGLVIGETTNPEAQGGDPNIDDPDYNEDYSKEEEHDGLNPPTVNDDYGLEEEVYVTHPDQTYEETVKQDDPIGANDKLATRIPNKGQIPNKG